MLLVFKSTLLSCNCQDNYFVGPEKGEKGDPGLSGILGQKGDAGMKGAKGDMGADGFPGVPGKDGAQVRHLTFHQYFLSIVQPEIIGKSCVTNEI